MPPVPACSCRCRWCYVITCLAGMLLLAWRAAMTRWLSSNYVLTWPWHGLTYPHSLLTWTQHLPAWSYKCSTSFSVVRSADDASILSPTTHEATNHKYRIGLEAKLHKATRQLRRRLSVSCRALTNKKPSYLLSCSWINFVSDTIGMCTQSRRRGW